MAGMTITQDAYANPPSIDYLFTHIDLSVTSCLADARKTMEHFNMKEVNSTGNHELVGVKDNYKSVIACIDTNGNGNSELTFFIVSGPSYKKAAFLNEKMKEYWDSL